MSHTRGPWKFEELAASDGDGYVLSEGDTVICHHGGAYSKYLPRDEVLGNALLITAAPDLYDALSDLLGQCETDDPVIETGLARAALSKARGDT